MNHTIILASSSPRRKELLKLAGIKFKVHSSNCEEIIPKDLPIQKVPKYLACLKGKLVQKEFPLKTIIAADTVVIFDNKIIGKPINRANAIKMLKTLSGNTHQVITGVCIFNQTSNKSFSVKTNVTFNPLTLAQIEYYVDKFNPYDIAGAYAIQEWIGLVGIKKISGCYYNVMGLPISKLIKYLK